MAHEAAHGVHWAQWSESAKPTLEARSIDEGMADLAAAAYGRTWNIGMPGGEVYRQVDEPLPMDWMVRPGTEHHSWVARAEFVARTEDSQPARVDPHVLGRLVSAPAIAVQRASGWQALGDVWFATSATIPEYGRTFAGVSDAMLAATRQVEPVGDRTASRALERALRELGLSPDVT
jgi:hypothetical protein